jgi:uncharacterized protein (TIGR03435 family)
LLLAYQGFERGVATFYDLPGIPSSVPTAPQFEVASIKALSPSAPVSSLVRSPIITTPGRLTARSASLKDLIRGAYALEDYQVSLGSGSIALPRFDVEAKATDGANRDQLLMMLRALLTDRFKLAFHRETKELAVNALVVARNGPKFHALKAGADPVPDEINHVHAQDLPFLAGFLTRYGSDIPVIDRTGLTGDFDIDLDLSRVTGPASQRGGAAGERTREGGVSREDLFWAMANAVQEQLGLRLVATKAPIEVLVVDHVEKPTEN